MNGFQDKTIFITGGSSGIGLATAKNLAMMGADIVLFARKKEPLQAAVDELKKVSDNDNQSFNWLEMDVADNNDVETKISQAVSEFSAPDIVINCAGTGFAAEFETISADQFDHLLSINVSGTRNVVAAVLPYMKKQGRGTIVVVASTAGLIPVYGYTAYGASKYATIGFAECLRAELKPKKINVAVFCPPEVDTPLVEEEKKTSPPETKFLKQMAGRLTADYTAQVLIRGIEKNQFMIIPGFLAKMLYFTQKFSPAFIVRGSSDFLIWFSRKIKKK